MIRIARLFTLLALSLCSTVAFGAAPKPELIPSSPKAYTQAQFDKARLAYYNRVIVESYKKLGTHDSKWDAAATTFLQHYCEGVVYLHAMSRSKEIAEEGKAVIASGCSDPMVQACTGMQLRLIGSLAEAEPLLRAAVDAMEKKPYPRCRATMAALDLNRTIGQQSLADSNDHKRLKDLAMKWTVEAFQDGSFKPGDDRMAVEFLNRENTAISDTGFQAELQTAILKAKGVSPWLAKFYKAAREYDMAWAARGNGLADKVTPEGWKGFEEHQAAGAKLYIEAWKLHPEYPEVPSVMIAVTNGGTDAKYGTPLQWFKRVLTAQVDYMPAYSSYSWSLRPRWGGSLEAVDEFGIECLKTGRFDTLIPWEYINALKAVTSDLSGDMQHWQLPETWPRIQLMCDGYAKSGHPQIGTATECESIRAAAAYNCGKYAEAKKIVDALGDKLDQARFGWISPDNYTTAMAKIQSLGGPLGEQMLAAEKLHDAGGYTDALAAYQALREKSKEDKYAGPYVDDRIEAIKLEKAVSGGGWVDLKPRLGSANWTAAGNWTVEPDGTIVGACTKAGLSLLCNVNLGDRVEVQGEVEFIKGKMSPQNAGVLLYSCTSPRFVFFYPGPDWALAGYSVPNNTGIMKQAGVTDKNTFFVRQWDGKVTVRVNGKQLHTGYYIQGYFPNDRRPRIGVGGWPWGDSTPVKFRKLQVRRLTAEPSVYLGPGRG